MNECMAAKGFVEGGAEVDTTASTPETWVDLVETMLNALGQSEIGVQEGYKFGQSCNLQMICDPSFPSA